MEADASRWNDYRPCPTKGLGPADVTALAVHVEVGKECHEHDDKTQSGPIGAAMSHKVRDSSHMVMM
jgi:hypothetical protein